MCKKILNKIVSGWIIGCLVITAGMLIVSSPRNIPNVSATDREVNSGNPNDYDTIQDAIDNANPKDNIVIFEGIYTENVNVDTEVTIKPNPGDYVVVKSLAATNDDVFHISADNCTIQDLMVWQQDSDQDAIFIDGNSQDKVETTTIRNCTIISNYKGINADNCNNQVYIENSFTNCMYGIYIDEGDTWTISHTDIIDCNFGIYINENVVNAKIYNSTIRASAADIGIYYKSEPPVTEQGNKIYKNRITGFDIGIKLEDSTHLEIEENHISRGGRAIYGKDSNHVDIIENFINDVSEGVKLDGSSSQSSTFGGGSSAAEHLNVTHNVIRDSELYPIKFLYLSDFHVENNTIHDNQYGTYFKWTNNGTIKNNTISESNDTGVGRGVYMKYSEANSIQYNLFIRNRDFGVFLSETGNTTVTYNAFIGNNDWTTPEATDVEGVQNLWDGGSSGSGNYWNGHDASGAYTIIENLVLDNYPLSEPDLAIGPYTNNDSAP